MSTTVTGATTLRQTWAAVRMMVVATLVVGLAYPLVLTGLAQVVFPGRSDGSLVRQDGRVVGSSLIGQSFAGDARYFQSRPSAAGNGYDPLASSASNLAPTSPVLLKQIQQRRATVAKQDGIRPGAVAPDALEASGSGLDPQISPLYAAQQVHRVAAARGLSVSAVRGLVQRYTQGRPLGFLGEPAVDVLDLNLALDRLSSRAR